MIILIKTCIETSYTLFNVLSFSKRGRTKVKETGPDYDCKRGSEMVKGGRFELTEIKNKDRERGTLVGDYAMIDTKRSKRLK